MVETSPLQPPSMSYKLKTLQLVDGRLVPVVLQAANGPCPLLAVANVLLLRGAISLPPHAPDISEERLVSILAGWLLDSNNSAKLGEGVSPEYAANLEQNLADAVARLPKLTTGIDLNPRFHDCRAYEFTDEVAIFDLLQVPLLHGWLVDPQDEEAVKVIGGSSYNELLLRLIALLGEDAPAAAVAPPSLAAPPASLAAPPAAAAEQQSAAAQQAAAGRATQVEASDDSFNARLQAALAASLRQQSASDADTAPVADTPTAAAAAAFDSAVAAAHSRGGSVHITGPVPGVSELPAVLETHASVAPAPESPKFTLDDEEDEDFDEVPIEGGLTAASAAEAAVASAAVAGSSEEGAAVGASAAEAGAAPLSEEEEMTAAVKRLVQAAFRTHLGPPAPLGQRDPKQLAEAQLIQDFLSTSQLTYHGLTELHQALQPGQLAVFFRNNHFGTLVKHNDGALYLLVTDQGYLREPRVAWERLSGIDGDTQFFQADFTPYVTKPTLQQQASAAAALAQAAFAGGAPGGDGKGAAAAGVEGTGGKEVPNTAADADLAMALQLQEDEEEAARQRQRAEAQRRAAAQQAVQQQQQQAGRPGQPQAQSEGQGSRWQRRQGGDRRHGQRPEVLTGQAPPKDKCTIM